MSWIRGVDRCWLSFLICLIIMDSKSNGLYMVGGCMSSMLYRQNYVFNQFYVQNPQLHVNVTFELIIPPSKYPHA